MTAKIENRTAEEILAKWRAKAAARRRAQRARAGAVLGGLTLDGETVAALKRVQVALRAPSRSAAIRAAIHLAAQAVELQQQQEMKP